MQDWLAQIRSGMHMMWDAALTGTCLYQFIVLAVHCCSRAGISQHVTGKAEGGNGGVCLMQASAQGAGQI